LAPYIFIPETKEPNPVALSLKGHSNTSLFYYLPPANVIRKYRKVYHNKSSIFWQALFLFSRATA